MNNQNRIKKIKKIIKLNYRLFSIVQLIHGDNSFESSMKVTNKLIFIWNTKTTKYDCQWKRQTKCNCQRKRQTDIHMKY